MNANMELWKMFDASFQVFHGIHLDLKENLDNGSNILLEANKRMDRKLDTLLHALDLQPLSPAFLPINDRIIEVSSTSDVAKLFPNFITSAPTIRIPILPPISPTAPVPTPSVYMSTTPQPPTPQSTPSTPISTTSQPTPTIDPEPSLANIPSSVHEPELQVSDIPQGSILFPKLSVPEDVQDDASSQFVSDDKKGKKDEETEKHEHDEHVVLESNEEVDDEIVMEEKFDKKKLDEEIEKLFEEEKDEE